jgi:glyoxylase-like metal-dependent hydrolase (beta-lactamase superfamily II)
VWGANVYLLADSEPTLVDTGFKGRCRPILRDIARLGYSPTDIKNVIITHHHADHTGSLSALVKATGARVVAHPADAPYIDGRLPQPGPESRIMSPFRGFWSTAPVPVDVLVTEGDELPILGGIKVLHTPGHTPGSISLLIPAERLLIAGDVLGNRFGLHLPSKRYTVDFRQELDSIKRLAALDFDVIAFGHGAPVTRDARSAIDDFLARLI